VTGAEVPAFGAAADRVASGADHHIEAVELVSAMTPEERLDCLDGDTDFWPGLVDMTTGGYRSHPWPAARVERLGVPGIEFADGPRGCVVGPATCFPVAMARGAAFDPDLERRVGDAIGAELRAAGATFTGAVCINLLRHLGWGRAQETYGEDPHHVGELGVAFVEGLQRHVMACAKHFALNSMENARFTVDVTVGERALHEVYLPHFRRVAEAGVASIMSAYNSVNGAWCGENARLLTTILREEWAWDGFVISDFMFGLRDAVASVGAGLDVEMPFRQQRAQVLADAVARGDLTEQEIDAAVTRIVATLLRFAPTVAEPERSVVVAGPDHRALAREAAAAGTVLVHHDGSTLPVDPADVRRVAVLGRLATVPNLGDGGSSDVRPPSVVTPLDGIRRRFGAERVVHDDRDVSITAEADLVVVVVGYTAEDEGEYIDMEATGRLVHLFPPLPDTPAPTLDADPGADGGAARGDSASAEPAPEVGFRPGGDRRSLRLREGDEELITAATAVSDRVVVVVMSGSGVVMPWLGSTAATLMIWYPGMEGGHALADVLTGRVEPGGRLPFAVPRDETDLVAFDPDATAVTYDLFHGQWLLDRNGVEPHLPFGWGLGYTSWEVGVVADGRSAEAVTVSVANTGPRAGSTVVQLYGGRPGSAYERPVRRLLGFAKVQAASGERRTVSIPFDLDTLAVRVDGGWVCEPGPYELAVGLHAHDDSIRLVADL
jgi:beta-glucosidase